jgi:TonB family protein
LLESRPQTIAQHQPSFGFVGYHGTRAGVTRSDVDRDHILLNAAEDRVVRVGMTIDASGKPTDLKVLQSTDKFTDQAILTAASQYRYKPATLNGNAVPMEMTVNFRIE